MSMYSLFSRISLEKFKKVVKFYNSNHFVYIQVHFSLVSNRIARFDEASFKSKFTSQNGKGFIWTVSCIYSEIILSTRIEYHLYI